MRVQAGFGFVVVDGQDDDIFVKASDTKDAFYHDKVKVVITAQKNGDRRREGKIIEILDHEVKTLVGTYQKNKNFDLLCLITRRLAVIYSYLRNTK